MRYSIYINAVKCQEWGLTLNQGALFDLLNQSSSWAKHFDIGGELFFWVSRNMVIDEIPLAYNKPDTVYRAFKELSEKGLIIHIKKGQKDLIRLTTKGKEWNAKNSDLNPNIGNESEIEQKNSEINPTFEQKLGNKSEKMPENSDLNPTDNITNNPITNNPITKKDSAPKKQKFIKPTLEQVKDYFSEQGQFDSENQANRFFDYYESNGWMVSKNPMKDWKATVRNWIRRNKPSLNFNQSQGNHNAISQPTYSPNYQQPVKSDAEIYRDKLMAEYDAFYGTASESAGGQGFSGNVYDLEKPV